MEQLNLFTNDYQPRFHAYLNHVGKDSVDQVKIHEFIIWISEKWREFDRMQGKTDTGRTKEEQERFTEYLGGIG